MEQPSLFRQVLLSIVPVCLAVVFSSVTFETPVSHVMLLEEKTGHDLEKAPVEQPLVNHDDGLISATKKLWKLEGWRGFVKGVIPHCITTLISVSSTTLLTAGLVKFMPAPRRGTFWIICNALFVAGVQNVLTTIMVTPATILRTRMRLQPASRKTSDEWRYLYLRTKLGEWFSMETMLPAILRYAVYDVVRIAAEVIVPLPLMANLDTAEGMVRLTQDMLRTAASSVLSSALAHPFKRCQELSAVQLKPLEQPSISTYKYRGLLDEIVRDSAWTGFYATLQEALLANSPNVLLFIPMNVLILRQMRNSHKLH